MTYSQASATLGSASNNSASGNYHATEYGYDDDGNRSRVESPTGTITDTIFDGVERPISIEMGTNDAAGSSNMMDVSDTLYDGLTSTAAPPATPSLSKQSGGSLAATTYYVTITYVGTTGETTTSIETSYAVPANYQLIVDSPASSGSYTGYNVYVGTTPGSETMQNGGTAVSLGTNWTEPTTGLVSGIVTPAGGIGDGNATETITHPGGGAGDRVDLMLYDWRDRLVATKQGALLASGVPNPSGETDGVHRPIVYINLDNLGEGVGSYQYDGDGVSLSDFASWTNSPLTDGSSLRALTTAAYDEQGRQYLSSTFSVGQSTGAISTYSLNTNTFYDHRGNVIEVSQPGGLARKHVYDGADRDVKDSTTDGAVLNSPSTAGTWSAAGGLTNDVVLSQALTTYDSDGNPILVLTKDRFGNDASTSVGDLGSPTSGIGARDSCTAEYYDSGDRPTDIVDVGTNGGSAWTRPSSVPSRSDTVLITHTDYDSAGRAYQVTDPRGIVRYSTFDLRGRTTQAIAAYDGGSPTK